MQWQSMDAFWAMGGYGEYVWGAFGVTLVGILIELILLKRGHRERIARLRRLQQWEAQ